MCVCVTHYLFVFCLQNVEKEKKKKSEKVTM